MNKYNLIFLYYAVSVLGANHRVVTIDTPAVPEFMWLRDLNNDAEKRHLDVGLSDELRFQLKNGETSIDLHLKQNPHIRTDTDTYVVHSLPDGTKRAMKETYRSNMETKYYHSIENNGFFIVRCVIREESPCARILEGSLRIGDKDFHIAPAPEEETVFRSLIDLESQTLHLLHEQRANDGNESFSDDYVNLNNDYKIAPHDADEKETENSLFERLRSLYQKIQDKEMALDKSKKAATVYGIEVFVAVDPPIWEKFYSLAKGSTENAMKRLREYISQVFNGVDLRYKSITGRSFSIYITLKGFIVAKTEATAPLQNVKPVRMNGELYINREYLSDFTDWVMNTPGMPSKSDYDHAMMISGYNFYKGTPSSSGIAGVAYLTSVCTDYRTSIVEERDYFTTMDIAAHELGHNLGASHDGSNMASGCSAMDQYIMNPYVVGFNPGQPYNPNPWTFSECSIKSIESNLALKSCVLDEATFYDKNEYDFHNRLKPGQMYSPNQQCQIAFGKRSYKCSSTDPAEICRVLQCYNPQKESCNNLVAANGTPCGSKKNWCIDGQCVKKLLIK